MLTTVLVLLVGLGSISATDADNSTSSIQTTDINESASSIQEVTLDDTTENTVEQGSITVNADLPDENEDSSDEEVEFKDDLSSDEAVDSTTYDVYDYDEFTAALDEIISSEVDQNYTINLYSDSWRQQYESTGSVKWGESGQLVHNLTINGNGITIDLNEDEFIFVSAGYTVTITNITLINGCTDASSALVHGGLTGYGGALFNEGNLILDNVIVVELCNKLWWCYL